MTRSPSVWSVGDTAWVGGHHLPRSVTIKGFRRKPEQVDIEYADGARGWVAHGTLRRTMK